MDDIKKIYIRANEQIEDIMDEKQTIFEELIYFVFSFYELFIYSQIHPRIFFLSSFISAKHFSF